MPANSHVQSRPLKSARYLLAMTEDEKATLDQRCREMAAATGRPVTLAEAMRRGAAMYLDDLAKQSPRKGVKVA
jgi:hypothetical protein